MPSFLVTITKKGETTPVFTVESEAPGWFLEHGPASYDLGKVTARASNSVCYERGRIDIKKQ